MTRKKRRAREARQMLEEDNNMDDEFHGENLSTKPPSMKKTARDHKRQAEEKEREKYSKSIHDEDVEHAERKKRKLASRSDALGDSSLFSEEKVAYACKNKKGDDDEDGRVKSNYNFRGFDPTKDGKKKKKQKSHHKFKSKAKFKRRK